MAWPIGDRRQSGIGKGWLGNFGLRGEPMRLITVILAAFVLAAGCSSNDTTATSTTIIDELNDVGGSMALDGQIPDDAMCHSLPQGCTPRPTTDQAQEIERSVAAFYPGVKAGKSADWAIAVCADILAGKSDDQLERNVTMRYAGGTRPDPTPEQAQQILAVVRSGGWCV